MDDRFLNACKGKSESNGGLNIAEFRRELIARYPNYKDQIDTMKRSELNELGRQLTSSAPNPISMNSSSPSHRSTKTSSPSHRSTKTSSPSRRSSKTSSPSHRSSKTSSPSHRSSKTSSLSRRSGNTSNPSRQVANRCSNDIYPAIANNDLEYIMTHYPNLDPNCRIQYISHERRKMNNYILHIAIIHRNLDIVKYLVDLGADLEVNDDFGNTALLIATDEYDPENEVDRDIVMLLINRGANVNAQTATGITPLYHAVNAGDLDLARLLLDRGADVNKIYFNNISVLHLASEYENLDMIRLLLDYGVDSSILDRENRSAEDYLVDMQNDELAQFIRNYTLNVKEPVSTT